MSEDTPAIPAGEGNRLAKSGLVVSAVDSVRKAAFPAVAAMFGAGQSGLGWLFGVGVGLVVMLVSVVFAYIGWTRFRYFIGAEDIRVESGVIGREARSVPFERIQDVSLEEKLLPRLFGLTQVKFETGAGGKDELALSYVTKGEGERLRELVRVRRDHAAPFSAIEGEPTSTQAVREPEGALLFSMDTRRLFKFGLFEFSLIIFAVLAGVAQQLDFLMPWDLIKAEFQARVLDQNGEFIDVLHSGAQLLAIVAGLAAIVVAGFATGIARTFSRDWDFRLERTAKGFRRRRGLFTRTDVVMPVHRVQAAVVNTGLIRRWFGWHSLKFVSLAQDAKSSSHVVAPFAQMEEIWPIAREAGIEPPPQDLDWRLPSWDRWFVSAAAASTILSAGAIFAGLALHWAVGLSIAVMTIPLVWGLNWLSWRRHRHARGARQLFIREGHLTPELRIAQRVKLQSVEIRQGPLGKWLGYADIHFGLAGGKFEMRGVNFEEAREMRSAVIESIVAVDFSDLPR